MKASSFDYVRARDLDDICTLLAEPAESRIIAGGQTLVPLMAMRLVRPERLIDINHVASLQELRVDRERGELVLGAMVRQADAERSVLVQEHAPLLYLALPWIGHQQTRNRGTVGGSLCNADPSAEIGLVATTLQANVEIVSARGTRSVPVGQFLVHAMETSLADDEFVSALRLPLWPANGSGCGFEEVNARASDFAVVAAAVQLSLDASGQCERIHCATGGASPIPALAQATADALIGTRLDDTAVAAAASLCADALEPADDIHASAIYRKRVAPQILARAILNARDNALKTS